jgi:23S rRNA (adenine2503-C2)-methyltransferase
MLNVIPYNTVSGLPFQTPDPQAIHHFRTTLLEGGINVMFRQRKGDGIDAACGQLRRNRPDLKNVATEATHASS